MSESALKLLKGSVPTYTLTLPLTKKRVKYRPFLVKEEKVLLLAVEEGDDESIISAIKNLIESCCEDIEDAGDLPILDLEYLFLNIRAKSVGDNVSPQIRDEETGEKVSLKIDLSKVKPKIPKDFSDIVLITDQIQLRLTPPTLNMSSNELVMGLTSSIEDTLDLLRKCIIEIITPTEVTSTKDMSDDEIQSFLDLLSGEQFESLSKYFEQIPELEHKVKYKLSNGEEKSLTIVGLTNFFN